MTGAANAFAEPVMVRSLVEVSEYAGAKTAWDSFVRQTPGGTFFHQFGWREVLEKSFGYKAHYLAATVDGSLVGVLPLFEVRPPFGAVSLLSTPFAVEGGVCAATPAARTALENAAVDLARERGARHLELRDGLAGGDLFRIREGTYFGFRREIFPSDEENLSAIPRKQRRMVRVGQKHGLVGEFSSDIDTFHDLYAQSVRQLGTPVFPASYFRLFLETFPEDCDLLIIRHEGKPASAVLSFYFNGAVLPYYAGSCKEFFRLAVNDFMYWELLCRARDRGMNSFDFGRSKKGTGAYDFKCHWGFEPQPLRYRTFTAGGESGPDNTANNARLQVLRRLWSHLPLPLTKILGPAFIRHFGAHYT